jgi:diaminopimelate decarboxylase
MEDEVLTRLGQSQGTPLYVYDGDRIVSQCKAFKKAFEGFPVKTKFCYAVKANTNLAILSLIRAQGFGADIVSLGELDAVHKAGFNPEDIIYNSNSKGEHEIKAAVDAGINMTCCCLDEIEAVKKAKSKRIAFRVNPQVDAKTHPKISTSLMGSKFGLHFENDIAYNAVKAAKMQGLRVCGIQCHIGSNVRDMSGFQEAAKKMLEFALKLKNELGINLDYIDLGGGLGVRYNDEDIVSVEEFANSYRDIVAEGVEKLGYSPEFWFEPGRYIVAQAGYLVAKVNNVKKTPSKNFINVDAGFNNLIRPAMYDAYHRIRIAGKTGEEIKYDIAGNLCESGDILGKDRLLPETEAGDYVIVENAGAYGYSMASNYNSMPLPAEVLVRGDKYDIIRKRQAIDELYIRQRIPKDLL